MGTRIGPPSLPPQNSRLLSIRSEPPPTQHATIPTAAHHTASREIARAKGERYLPGAYRLVTADVYRAGFSTAPLPTGASVWYHSFDGSWCLGKIKQASDVVPGRYIIRFLDIPGPVLIDLPPSAYNTALDAPCGSWCLQTHGRTNPLHGIFHG